MSGQPSPFAAVTESELRERFDRADYVADDRLVTTAYIALQLGRPLLVEGPPGSGKTELAKVLAKSFETELIRLQCYEGLTAENALYEWNYTKQLLAVQSDEGSVAGGEASEADSSMSAGDEPISVFDEEFLLERPLLRALTAEGDRPPVLLVDEIDRADAEFEAFLLELGTLSATHPPIVVLTSNRTRGLSDALKRRCLYLHVEPPAFDTEYEIVRRKVPELDAAIAAEVCAVVAELRGESFLKHPGVSETLDWARAVATLRDDEATSISPAEIESTLGCLLKEAEDIDRVDADVLERLHEAAKTASKPIPNE